MFKRMVSGHWIQTLVEGSMGEKKSVGFFGQF